MIFFGHDIIVAVVFFLLGAAVGSFTNVLIWRLPRRESIVFPGSHCPSCNGKIKFYDNIPILSYFILRGKCRNCKTHISIKYPIVEFAVGLAYFLSYMLYPPDATIEIIRMVLLTPIFLAIAWIDIRHWVIPDELTIAIAAVGLAISAFVGGWSGLLSAAIGGVGAALFYWLISILGKLAFKKDALGEGDIFLIGAIGLLVGWKGVIQVIFLAALLGSIGGLIAIPIRKKTGVMNDDKISLIPFGPFILLATMIILICGDRLLNWYLGLIG